MIYFLQGAPGATGEQGESGLAGDPVSCVINNSNYWIRIFPDAYSGKLGTNPIAADRSRTDDFPITGSDTFLTLHEL